MKYPKFTTLLIASTLLMPAIGTSQTSGSTSGSSSQGSSSTQPRQSGSSSSSQSGSQYGTGSQSGTTGSSGTSSSMRSGSSTSGMSQQGQSWSSGSLSSSLQRVSEDELENHVTASNLIGKTVKDRSGETIGEVKDIGLTQALQGASSSANRYSSTSGSGSLGSASADVSTSGVSGTARVGDRSASGSVNSSGVSGSTGRTTGTTGSSSTDLGQASRTLASSAASMLGQGDVNVIIEVEDADAFVAVPVSELRYDQTNEELTIQRSLSELQQVAQGSQSSSASRAAE